MGDALVAVVGMVRCVEPLVWRGAAWRPALLTGKVHALEFLKLLDAVYRVSTAIKLILDNHSAHIVLTPFRR